MVAENKPLIHFAKLVMVVQIIARRHESSICPPNEADKGTLFPAAEMRAGRPTRTIFAPQSTMVIWQPLIYSR
jgi:hypothetical protein